MSIKSILALLVPFGGEFTQTNQSTPTGTIVSFENELLQVRETRPRTGPSGVRVSVKGTVLSQLAQTDGGLAKLRFHLDIAEALRAGLPSNMEVRYNDAPGRNGRSYPTLFINAAQAPAMDVAEVVRNAKEAGVPRDKLLDLVGEEAWDKIVALTALYVADVPTDDEHEQEADEAGDSAEDEFPA